MDIFDAQASDKSFSTVKVYRNPPSNAELADPRRFDSLPPDSLARPQKRPPPPLFLDPVRHDSREPIDHGHPLPGFSLTQPHGSNKRQKVEAYGSRPYTNLDRPLESLEDRNAYRHQSRAASVRPSPVRQVDGSQKRKRESVDLPNFNGFPENLHGSDPYGTPISSQTATQGLAKPRENEIISISDSPEIPAAASRLSPSCEASPQMPPPALPPAPNQEQEAQEKPGRLLRPKTLKPSPASKGSRKVINGVKQKTPSVFDPIETSEGSSYEREQLRSAKRLKTSEAPHQTPKSKKMRAQSSEHIEDGQQKEEELETKRKAQAEFDRIAAMPRGRKPVQSGETSEPASVQQNPSVDEKASRDSEPSARLPSAERPPLESMTFEERRQWNLKHLVPARNKQLRDINAKMLALKKQERAAQAEARRQEKQTRAQRKKEARMTAKEPAAKAQRADQPQVKIAQGDVGERRSAEEQVQEKENKIQELKTKVGRQRQIQQAEAEKPNLADFPQPTRMKTKQNAQQKESSAKEVAKEEEQKGKLVNGGKDAVETGTHLHVQSEAISDDARLAKETSMTEVSESKAMTQDKKPAPPQGVCNSYQSWLFDRSPEAKYNAERQLQLANQWLKQTKGDSMVAQIPRAAATSTSTAPTSARPGPQEKAQSRVKEAKKQLLEEQKGLQKRRGTTSTFTDREALRAAGISADSSTNITAQREAASRPGTEKAKTAGNAKANDIVSRKSQLLGILKAADSKSSSPVTDRSDPVRIRSMTPVIPSSLTKSSVASAEAKIVALKRAATVAPEALKTPIRTALRTTPGPSRRSVSFASDLMPLTQSQEMKKESMTQPSGSKKGMLYRAVEEANAKRAEKANAGAKAASSALRPTANKVANPPTRAKQTKMTHHISRDTKGKGKAVDRSPERRVCIEEPPNYSLYSDEAATYFSDESEWERGARAGPSSRKIPYPTLEASKKAAYMAGDKRPVNPNIRAEKSENDLAKGSSSSAKASNPKAYQMDEAPSMTRPAMDYGARVQATSTASAGKSITISSSSSSGYSDSEVENVFSQTDDISLLPRLSVSSQDPGGFSQPSGQRSATVVKTSSEANLRPSGVPEPSNTPKRLTADAEAARSSEERRLSQEADRQLQREHLEAMQHESNAKAPISKDTSVPSSQKVISVQQPHKGFGRSQNRPASKPAASAIFGSTSLSKLRQAQSATAGDITPKAKGAISNPRPHRSPSAVALSESSDSDSGPSSVDTDKVDANQNLQQKSQPSPAPKKKNTLSKVFTELWGSKK